MADQVALSPPSPDTGSTTPEKPGEGIGSQYREFKPLYDMFGIKNESPRSDKAFGAIWEYAKAVAPSKDKDSVLFEVIRLKNKLGSPGIGNNPYYKLELYAKIWKQNRESEKQLHEMET